MTRFTKVLVPVDAPGSHEEPLRKKKAAHDVDGGESEVAGFLEILKVAVADHDVIEELNANELTALGETMVTAPAARALCGLSRSYRELTTLFPVSINRHSI